MFLPVCLCCRMLGKISDHLRHLDNADKTLTRLFNSGIIDGYTGAYLG